MNKKFFLLITISIVLLMLSACGTQGDNSKQPLTNTDYETENNEGVDFEVDRSQPIPVVTMVMEDGGEVEIELYPSVAENTVNNFISLVSENYYDGLIFHRVIQGFMIQGGDPEGTGMGGPGYSIAGEFRSNGYPNHLRHTPGVISMARSQEPDSAGSQFFIVVGDSPHLDGDYAAFGKVIEGMDVVNQISKTETGRGDKPLVDQVIESMTVELNGYEPGEVEKQ